MHVEPIIIGILMLLTSLYYVPVSYQGTDNFNVLEYPLGQLTLFKPHINRTSTSSLPTSVPAKSTVHSVFGTTSLPTTVVPSSSEAQTTTLNQTFLPPTTEAPTLFEPNKNISVSHSMYVLKDFGTQPVNQYDYDDIIYPIPFDVLYNNEEMRYENFGKPDSRFPVGIELGPVTESAFNGSDHIFITGSSANHLFSNLNTMYSIMLCDIKSSIVFVDFGLDNVTFPALVAELKSMKHIFHLYNSPAQLYYRKFDFAHFPSWYSLNDRQVRGGYSWKVISYYDVLMESKRIVIWCDGGNLLPSNLDREMRRVKTFGLYTPYSGDSLQRWLHGKSQRFLSYNKMIRKLMLGKGMCTGGYVFINYNNETVMNNVIFPLVQCAYTRKCIAPLGSTRKNHRQDQAILTALVHSASIQQSCHGRYGTKCRFHQDCHTEERCTERKEKLKKILVHCGV